MRLGHEAVAESKGRGLMRAAVALFVLALVGCERTGRPSDPDMRDDFRSGVPHVMRDFKTGKGYVVEFSHTGQEGDYYTVKRLEVQE